MVDAALEHELDDLAVADVAPLTVAKAGHDEHRRHHLGRVVAAEGVPLEVAVDRRNLDGRHVVLLHVLLALQRLLEDRHLRVAHPHVPVRGLHGEAVALAYDPPVPGPAGVGSPASPATVGGGRTSRVAAGLGVEDVAEGAAPHQEHEGQHAQADHQPHAPLLLPRPVVVVILVVGAVPLVALLEAGLLLGLLAVHLLRRLGGHRHGDDGGGREPGPRRRGRP